MAKKFGKEFLRSLREQYEQAESSGEIPRTRPVEPDPGRLPVWSSKKRVRKAAAVLRGIARAQKYSWDGWTFIYALVDPRDGKYCYIGKSNHPKKRLRQHIEDLDRCNYLKTQWLKELAAKKLAPQLKILEKCRMEDWKDRERAWIKATKQSGILNLTDGGDQSA